MKNSPFFSIILPALEEDCALCTPIESVLSQTDADWELLVIIDASCFKNMGLVRTCAGADPRVRIVRTETPFDNSAYLNEAAAEARGKWIVPLGKNDAFHPEYLQRMRRFVKDKSDGFIVSCWITAVAASGEKKTSVCLPDASTIRRLMEHESFLPHTGTCFPKKLWSKTGGYPEEEAGLPHDRGLWLRFFKAGADLHMLEEHLVYQHIGNSSIVVKEAETGAGA